VLDLEDCYWPIHWNKIDPILTVAETPEYVRRADSLLNPEERREIINYLASRPRAGVLIEGTGGVRKLRWGRHGRGKSGGVRVIYYVHSEAMPLYLLTLFAKIERVNLSKVERNQLANLEDTLVKEHLKRAMK
jgi:mRNA-degrading endonuclease RelE of RelBE toxin-antitoxin system